MTVFEAVRRFEKMTNEVIIENAIESVVYLESTVKSDLIKANDEGLTFAGNQIEGHGDFTDWIETGTFRRNLKFLGDDIELISYGEGYEAIQGAFDETDYIAPSAKVLSKKTLDDIRAIFIHGLLNIK